MSNLVLWGASGHGKVVLYIARAMAVFGTISFIDDACAESAGQFCGLTMGSDHFASLRGGKSGLFVLWFGADRAISPG